MTKPEREEREYKSLFSDERYAKKAWKDFIGQSLESRAADLPAFEDAKGNVSPQSVIYQSALNEVRKRLKAQGIDREPMKAEVLVEANVIRAAFDNNVFTTLLDRTAGKVKEELSINNNDYAELSDEELKVLAEYRHAKKLLGGNKDASDSNE